MKELTKKILEAGLVDKHLAAAMERWGSLDRGSSDIVGTCPVTKETFEAFAEDIATLVDADEPIRETILDELGKKPNIKCRPSGTSSWVPAYMDTVGCIIVDETFPIHPLLINPRSVIEVENRGIFVIRDFSTVEFNDGTKGFRLTVMKDEEL